MRARAVAILILGLAFALPASAWAGYAHYWTWQRAPDPARTRAAIAEMVQIARAQPDRVRVESDGASVTIEAIGDRTGEPFRFPCMGRDCQPGAFNACKTLGAPYDSIVTSSLLVARDHFGPGELQIASDGTFEDWQPGRALYARVLHRDPPDGPLVLADPDAGGMRASLGPFGWFRGALAVALVIGVLAYLLGGARARDGMSWGTYYLAWIVLPTAIAIVSAHPIVLAVAAIAIAARRWLPDPFLLAKHARRTRSLEAQVRANPSNVTACRDLGMIWLERRRPRRALGFVEQGLVRAPDDVELRYLAALARHGAGEHEAAATTLLAIARDEPRFRQGDATLRAADALSALRRWDQAIAALRAFAARNRSSVEARVKLARALRRTGDRAGAATARADARQTYGDLPGFQQRAQRLWYARAWLPF